MSGGLDIIGIGVAESKGLKRGVVVNLEAAVESIKKSIEEAELMAGVEIGSVHLGVSGPHIKGFNSRGVVAVAGKNREVTREDVRRAIDAARAVSLPAGREILHVLPQDFVVDEQEGIGAPVGLTGARLEVNVHIVTGSQAATQNLVACVNRAGVEVADTVIEPAGRQPKPVLTDDEKELGVALVDIGGGTADLAIFERGSLWHTAVVGGRRRSLHQRHRRRPAHADSRGGEGQAPGAAARSPAMVDEDETIEVASVGGRRPRVMARRILSDILQPRAEEMFHLVWDEIRKAGYEKIAQLGHGAHRRRRDPRRHAGDRRADFRPADPARLPDRRRRPRRSRRTARRSRRRRAGAATARNAIGRPRTGAGRRRRAHAGGWAAARCSRSSSNREATNGRDARMP